MKAHMQFGLLKLADPRVVRALLLGLTLGLMLLAGMRTPSPVEAAPAVAKPAR